MFSYDHLILPEHIKMSKMAQGDQEDLVQLHGNQIEGDTVRNLLINKLVAAAWCLATQCLTDHEP